MKIGITLNEVVRHHYFTVEEAYEMHVREVNQSISKEVFDELSEEVKDKVEKRIVDVVDISSELAESVEQKAAIELQALKVYDMNSIDLDKPVDEWADPEEVNLEIKRDFIAINESDDPMNLSKIHMFKDKADFEDFLYQDQAFEIFSRTPLKYPHVMLDLDRLYSILSKRQHTVSIVSQERENSKPATLLFLAQNYFKGNNIKFIYDYSNIWELYDLIITADPYIANKKPEKKICLLVNTEHNQEVEGKGIFKFDSLKEISTYIEKHFK
jgi:hypothetical protein